MEGRPPRWSPSARSLALALGLAVSASLGGCGGVGFIGTTASSFLRHIRESDDPNVRYAAYTKLSDPHCYSDEEQKREAVAVLVSALERGDESVATQAAICRTLGSVGGPEALTVLRKAALHEDPIIRAEATRALGRIGTTEDASLLARVMAVDVSRDCRVAAIEALGDLEAIDPRIGLMLAEGMRNPDPAIRAASYKALKSVTGEDFGFEVDRWDELARSRLDQSQQPPG